MIGSQDLPPRLDHFHVQVCCGGPGDSEPIRTWSPSTDEEPLYLLFGDLEVAVVRAHKGFAVG